MDYFYMTNSVFAYHREEVTLDNISIVTRTSLSTQGYEFSNVEPS